MLRADFDFSGLPVSISSESSSIVKAFESAWEPFLSSESHRATTRLLDVIVREDSTRIVNSEPIPKGMRCQVVGGRLDVHSRDATATADAAGACELLVGAGPPLPQFYAISNAMLAAVAFRLPKFGGVLLHAAALVVDQQAFVLPGPSGTGKSTWAWGGRQEGAEFVSDDIVAVRAFSSHVAVLSLPFRGDHPTPLSPSQWKLRAVLLPKWGDAAALERASALSAHVQIEASVLYRDILRDHDALAAIIDAIVAVPTRVLVFPKHGPFVDVLRVFR